MTDHLVNLVRMYQSEGSHATSHQSFAVLDELLIRGLSPIEAESRAFREWSAEILTIQLNSRRRYNQKLVSACLAATLGLPDAAHLVIAAGADRGSAIEFLGRFVESGSRLERFHVEFCRRGHRSASELASDALAAENDIGRGPYVVAAVREVRYWLERATKFKAKIASDFLKLLYKNASRSAVVSGDRVDKNDAFQTAYLAIFGAIDRYQSSAGPLASFVGKWLMAANRDSASHSLGLASPGKRMRTRDASHTVDIEHAVDVTEFNTPSPANDRSEALLTRIDAISSDPDVRALLWLSDITPPAAKRARTEAE